MKKATVTVSFDEDKLNAVQLYMKQRGLRLEDELEKATAALYHKFVPANVRDFLELSSGQVPSRAKKIPASSAVVGDQEAGAEM